MTDPIARPGNDDPSLEHATDRVVDTWETSAAGKDADADSADFERMREGFGELADRGGRPADEAGVTDHAATDEPGSSA